MTRKTWLIAIVAALALLAAGAWVWASRTLPNPALQAVQINADWQPQLRIYEGVEMALAPVGCFQMGSTDEQVAEAQADCDRFYAGTCIEDLTQEQPAHEVCFEDPFWIDRYEVTNDAYGSSSSTDMEAMYRGPNWPRESVTWQQAHDFCAQRGARLPSEAEWEYAARGPDGWTYPWGNEFDIDRINRALGNPQDVGNRAEGVNWIGAYDFGGGVREWVDGTYANYAGEDAAKFAGLRIVRGGSWFSFADFMYRTAGRGFLDGDYASSVVGFRCVMDYETKR
jgi:formylglycine-generating enzyme required for sulfatase activity